ncbi:MAG: hypothetical protein ACI9UA_006073, partial [Pseudoalteromonas tetraodonis]
RNGREQLDADGMGSPTPTPAPEKNLLAVILARNSLAAVAPSRLVVVTTGRREFGGYTWLPLR